MKARQIKYNSIEPVLIPMMNTKVAAGFPSPAMDYAEDPIDLAKLLAPHPHSTFYVENIGDSMIDACIPPKSILIVDKSLKAVSGDIVIAFLNGDFTVKFIRFENDNCFLVPANQKKNYPTIKITEEMEMVVWGVVAHIVIDSKNIRLCTRS